MRRSIVTVLAALVLSAGVVAFLFVTDLVRLNGVQNSDAAVNSTLVRIGKDFSLARSATEPAAVERLIQEIDASLELLFEKYPSNDKVALLATGGSIGEFSRLALRELEASNVDKCLFNARCLTVLARKLISSSTFDYELAAKVSIAAIDARFLREVASRCVRLKGGFGMCEPLAYAYGRLGLVTEGQEFSEEAKLGPVGQLMVAAGAGEKDRIRLLYKQKAKEIFGSYYDLRAAQAFALAGDRDAAIEVIKAYGEGSTIHDPLTKILIANVWITLSEGGFFSPPKAIIDDLSRARIVTSDVQCGFYHVSFTLEWVLMNLAKKQIQHDITEGLDDLLARAQQCHGQTFAKSTSLLADDGTWVFRDVTWEWKFRRSAFSRGQHFRYDLLGFNSHRFETLGVAIEQLSLSRNAAYLAAARKLREACTEPHDDCARSFLVLSDYVSRYRLSVLRPN